MGRLLFLLHRLSPCSEEGLRPVRASSAVPVKLLGAGWIVSAGTGPLSREIPPPASFSPGSPESASVGSGGLLQWPAASLGLSEVCCLVCYAQ